MRLFPILFVVLCFASFADARPFRRASCAGGSCNVAQPAPVDVKKINPLDLTMADKKAPPQTTTTLPVVQSDCAGGQCVTARNIRIMRVFRR